MNTREQVIKSLEQTDSKLRQLTEGLSDALLDNHPTPEDWSIREILAHLVDDEIYVMRLRLERIVKEDQPILTPHDEKKWYANRNKTHDQLDQLLADFTLQRQASLAIVRMLREEDWQRQGTQPEYGTFTAEAQVTMWLEHDTTHLDQIERLAKQAV
ncbi:MAG: DinB family protein [Chloroflexota bacterium]